MSLMVDKVPACARTSAPYGRFLELLPNIRFAAKVASHRLHPAERPEFVAEVIAKSFVAFARLVARGEPERAHTSALARFAIAQTFSGRRVGGRLRVRDVLSPYAQRRKRLRVTRLDEYDEEARVWREIFVRDLSPSPAALAASRIDFADWLDRLPSFVRRIALSLASGETTSEAAKLFRLSPGRISQIRRWLWESWQTFQGDRRR